MTGFFAPLRMTTFLCHPDPECSEGEGSPGFFAPLRMTRGRLRMRLLRITRSGIANRRPLLMAIILEMLL